MSGETVDAWALVLLCRLASEMFSHAIKREKLVVKVRYQ
jgi:hypothetical protein